AVTRIFNLIPGDRGRPLTDIAHHLDYAELPQDIQQVFGARQPLERRVNRRDGTAHYIVRALPYWTGSGKVEGAVLTFSDVTGLAQAEEQQRILVAELNHRVKNMLTVIVSIATQTLKNSHDMDAARDAFLDRLHAMARSYELVSRDQWGDVSLADVVRQEVEPYRTGRDDRIVIDGPGVSLKPKLALSLGMIIHELGTNSVKYGSLSAAGGSLEVSWAIERRSGTSLVLDWVERGGPTVGKPPRHGFGLTLIEREVSHGLGGKAKIEFEDSGLRVNLRMPLDSQEQTVEGVVDGLVMPTFLFGPPTKPTPEVRHRAGQAKAGQGKPRVGRAGRRVLIVEDEAIIAGLIEAILRQAGWSVVGPVATLERALETIERERLDAALVDVRINGHDAFAVADVLMRRRIPFIFVSGFPGNQRPRGARDGAHIAKPFTPDAISARLDEILARRRL